MTFPSSLSLTCLVQPNLAHKLGALFGGSGRVHLNLGAAGLREDDASFLGSTLKIKGGL